MNGFSFTEELRATLARAREEAAAMGEEFVTPNHQLLAILHTEDAFGNMILSQLGVNGEALANRVRSNIRVRKPVVLEPSQIAYTSPAKHVLESAMTEARGLNHDCIGTEHLLIGILREDESTAAAVLRSFDVTADTARTLILTQGRDFPTR